MAKKNSKVPLKSSSNAAEKDAFRLWTSDPAIEVQFNKGNQRDYLKTTPSLTTPVKRGFQWKEWPLLALIVVFALFVRCSRLWDPDSVVFDEVHFGGFTRKYILRTFFMDVHPPLAKMIFAAIGKFAGFKGDFEFKEIGEHFPATTPYVALRMFPAILGLASVVLCYLTLKASGCRPFVCFITSAAFLIENCSVTISRYILLDSPLLFLIALSIYFYKKFEVQVPFTVAWLKYLLLCGFALGLAVSTKWVGIFTIAWVGMCCIYQLWFIIGDLSVSNKKIFGHFFARGIVLLGIPLLVYVALFAVHFSVLNKEGDGSPFMSSAFRASLEGNSIPKDITANVGFGSTVTIRHLETLGGYLHSHDDFYPTGSNQQQITLYPYLDSNNDWMIEPYNETIPDEFVPITNGMKVRLVHLNTQRRLHSHDEKPPVSERDWQKEASCYGFEGFEGDANDDFFVEIVDHKSVKGEAQHAVKAIQTVFRLRHVMTGQYLFSSPVSLPDWGFGQQEVTTASQGRRPLTYWYIESNFNPRINDTTREVVNYPKFSFLDKMLESHKRMWKINQGLTEYHNWQSSPTEWPLLLRGINYWGKENRQVYLIGNLAVWWSASLAIAAFFVHTLISLLRWKLGYRVAKESQVFNFNSQVFTYVLGWVTHYAPFYIMGRQLFFHHYLPANYFAILAMGHFFEIFIGYFCSNNLVLRKIGFGTVALFLMVSVLVYLRFSPLIDGSPWTRGECVSSKFLSSWDFDCDTFLNE